MFPFKLSYIGYLLQGMWTGFRLVFIFAWPIFIALILLLVVRYAIYHRKRKQRS